MLVSVATIEPGADRCKILHHIIIGLVRKYDLDLSLLSLKQSNNVMKPKPSQPISVFNHDDTDREIAKQGSQLRARIIQSRGNLGNHLADLITLHGAGGVKTAVPGKAAMLSPTVLVDRNLDASVGEAERTFAHPNPPNPFSRRET